MDMVVARLECSHLLLHKPRKSKQWQSTVLLVLTSGFPMNDLYSSILRSIYTSIAWLKTYDEVIGEIYNQVDHVKPWTTGNCRGPSSAFCLLYKFFTMKLTVKQMHDLLKHPDSPYIRAGLMAG